MPHSRAYAQLANTVVRAKLKISISSLTPLTWDKEADLLHHTLEDEYYTALQAYLEALSTTVVPPAALKRKYMCGHCGVLKKGHVCPNAEGHSAQEAERLVAVGSGGCEADAQISY